MITIGQRRILIIDDEPAILGMIETTLRNAAFEVITASTGQEGLERVATAGCDLVLTDLRLPDMDGVEVMHQIHARTPSIPIIIMTAYGTIENAVDAVKQGAYDYLTKPMDMNALIFRINKALEFMDLHSEVQHLRDALKGPKGFDRIIRASGPMDRVCQHAAQLAPTDVTILVQGESGTGKEMLAQAIHDSSTRADAPLVTIDCATLTETLLENELFGHARGAYTGAHGNYAGLLSSANHGTVFLDEIGDMPLSIQAKLLRVLQERSFRPIGSTKSVSVDVRFIVATNKNLSEEVREGTFREDLFYRISAATLVIPPLRDRPDDIPVLARHFLSTCSPQNGRELTGFSHGAMQRLIAYHWPGNIRELFNKIKYAAAITQGPLIEAGDLFTEVDDIALRPLRRAKEEVVRSFEQQYLTTLLRAHEGNVAEAAKTAGVKRTNLYALLRRYDLDPASFKPAVSR